MLILYGDIVNPFINEPKPANKYIDALIEIRKLRSGDLITLPLWKTEQHNNFAIIMVNHLISTEFATIIIHEYDYPVKFDREKVLKIINQNFISGKIIDKHANSHMTLTIELPDLNNYLIKLQFDGDLMR
jgi:hypothetical protein